jgi:two-component system CheB/CheR fusion protein
MKEKNHSTAKPEAPDDPAPILNFTVVGIGASAGGLAAFEAFFSGMPTDSDPGMAFVLVQHLDPNHKSLLCELIQHYTRMQVHEVYDGIVVQSNSVYIIPPAHDMAFLNGALHLIEPVEPRGLRLPIDFFFRSLAQDQREKAIGIVLAGTGSDGMLGMRAIKGEGGMFMAQKPESTEFDSMPLSCIKTGLVDYVLTPIEMPAQLIAYASQAYSKPTGTQIVQQIMAEGSMKKIFILLRAQTGHDFSLYKPSSIQRRIERRMAVHQIDSIENYVKYLQQAPDETDALFRDILIGVTNFFRDPEAFKVLEEVAIPIIFENKVLGSEIRVWSAGCSTGEEAYSIAILLFERMQSLKQNYAIQVFATDIDSRAIATARAGVYPASIADDISPERLARFFTPENDGGSYRIHKSIRDLMVFSEQDLIKDPPFSRLDLISCRNLMIYLSADLQRMLIPMFHYALKPDGILFLGISEGIGEANSLFAAIDRKSRMYQCKEDLSILYKTIGRTNLSLKDIPRQIGSSLTLSSKKTSLREMAEQAILREITPMAALVNDRGDLLYLHGRAGMFLEPSPGETGINNILKMAREGLRSGLTTSLRKSVASKEPTSCTGLHIKTHDGTLRVDVTVHPVPDGPLASSTTPLYLIILKNVAIPEGPPEMLNTLAKGAGSHENQILAMQAELRAKENEIESSHSELERSNEEFKSFNEELQSVNEELQSTNEELETSKEEMQSINEELATVNAELQSKVLDFARVNDDINNLIAGTGIASVFVNHQLSILRFTPAATKIINLIPSDLGRAVNHIVSNLIGYNELAQDIHAVIDTLVSRDKEVQATTGGWYSMRIQPYRTLDNVIEGAVISFIDITEIVNAREQLQMLNQHLRLAVVVRDSYDAITVQDMNGKITAWNPAAVLIYGWSEAEALGMNATERIPAQHRKHAAADLVSLSKAEILTPSITQRLAKDGKLVDISLISTALINEAGATYAIATTERVVSKK